MSAPTQGDTLPPAKPPESRANPDHSSKDSAAAAPPGARSHWWLVLLGLAIVELVGHLVIVSRVPPLDDFRQAAAFVRGERRDGDLVVAAPYWADPLVRWTAGDMISFADAGRSDLAGHRRLWVLSTRGHRPDEAPDTDPELDRSFGRVRVLRWALPAPEVVFDLTASTSRAEVSIVEGGTARICPWRSGVAQGGGLGAGPMKPAQRFECDPRRPWLWVAPTINEDLELQPRFCVWQHPAGPEPIRTTFRDVPLGDRLVLYAGLYYEHERKRENGPVDVRVLVDDREIGRMTHRDGDGWKRMEVLTRAPGSSAERGTIAIEVTAPSPHLRSLCWSATTRTSEARR